MPMAPHLPQVESETLISIHNCKSTTMLANIPDTHAFCNYAAENGHNTQQHVHQLHRSLETQPHSFFTTQIQTLQQHRLLGS
jgi:hypothetical protein